MPAAPAFGRISRSTVAAQVAEQIRRAIVEEKLRPGDRLPAQLRLAEEFGVSRAAIREALNELKGAGLVDFGRRGRDGGPVVTALASSELAHMLGTHLRLQAVSLPALVEFRTVIEVAAAGWAARRRSSSDLEKLRGLVERMERPGLSWPAYHDLDVSFHLAVAESSQNPCAALVMSAIREAMRRAMLEGFRQAERPDAVRTDVVREHREIHDAIEAGRPQRAEELVHRHILDFYSRLFPLG